MTMRVQQIYNLIAYIEAGLRLGHRINALTVQRVLLDAVGLCSLPDDVEQPILMELREEIAALKADKIDLRLKISELKGRK